MCAERDGAACFYCGTELDPEQPEATVDHVIPLSRGGTNQPRNLVLACTMCNHGKGERTMAEWFHRDGCRVPKVRQRTLLALGRGHANGEVKPHVTIERFRHRRRLYRDGYPLHPALVAQLDEARGL
jgi:hypothetical protein